MPTKTTARPRNVAQTRARILAAAATAFSTAGYGGAGLREIADLAEVAPSLVSKYFGTKAALFERALLEVIDANSVFTWVKEGFGTKMARLIAERSNAKITIMLVHAIAHPESRDIALGIYRQYMIKPLVVWLGGPNAESRAMDMWALMSGFVIQMHGLHDGPLPEHSLDWLAETLQAIVDGRPVGDEP